MDKVIPSWLILSTLVLLGIFTIWDKLDKDKKSSIKMDNFLEESQKQKELLIKISEEKKTSINLLNNLLNNGIIEQEEILEHMPSSDVYCLFCFPTTIRKIEIGEGENKEEYTFGQRIYPIFLKEIGFVRANRFSTVFITTPRRLTKNFRNTEFLRDYILKEIDKTLNKEWKQYVNGLKNKKGFEKYYKKYKKIDYTHFLKFSIAIIRGKLDEKNVKYLYDARTYSKDFEDLLKEEIDFRYVNLPRKKKVEIKRFVLDSSIELFFYGINQEELEKIIDLEVKLKEKLKIKKFVDYLKKSDEDISNVFKEKFSNEDSLSYSKLLKKRVNEYNIALNDLSISI